MQVWGEYPGLACNENINLKEYWKALASDVDEEPRASSKYTWILHTNWGRSNRILYWQLENVYDILRSSVFSLVRQGFFVLC